MRNKTSLFPRTLLFSALSLATAMPVLAEDLGDIVVTANRVAEPGDEVLAPVTVIDRKQIERSSAISVEELLIGTPGVAVARTGGPGKQTSLFLRGTNSDHVLVMVDGVKIGSAASGLASINNLPLPLIDRIEIVRGSRSSVYGSEAIGGVIQIFTRKARQAFEGQSQVTVGQQDTSQLYQFLGGEENGTRWSLAASKFDTDGENALDNSQPDDDGFNMDSIDLKLAQRLTDKVSVDGHFLQSRGDNDFDDAYGVPTDDNSNHFVQQVASVGVDYAVLSQTTLRLQYAQSRDDNQNYLNNVEGNRFETRRNQYLLQSDTQLNEHHLVTLGLERMEDDVDATTAYSDDTRSNNAAFGLWMGSYGKFEPQIGLRYDDNDAFGDKTTGNLTLGYRALDLFQPYVSAGTGFKAPDLSELYYPASPFFVGNPDLTPEESTNYELGIRGERERFNYAFNVYHMDITDLIAFDGNISLINIDDATSEGAELQLGYVIDGWSFDAMTSYTRATDDNTNEQLLRRPKWNGQFRVTRDWQRFLVNAAVRAQGSSADMDFNAFPAERVRLAGFALLDLGAGFKPRENITISAKVANVFDQQYQTVLDYGGDSRLFLATVDVTY